MSKEEVQPITKEDIAAFQKKLGDWAKDLPPKDAAMLQLMLEQGAAGDAKGEPLSEKSLEGVTGGMRSVGGSLGGTVLKAHGTSKKTDVVTKDALGRPSWDTDSEWDYSPY